MKSLQLLVGLAGLAAAADPTGRIDRERIVRSFNPHRSSSSDETPLQVGNGNFAFGADVTGLQTFRPFATMSTWGWHSFPLPEEENQNSPEGVCRLVSNHLHRHGPGGTGVAVSVFPR